MPRMNPVSVKSMSRSFLGRFLTDQYYERNYDVAPDGNGFLMILDEGTESPPITQLNVVLNWFDELERLVP